MSAIRTWGRVRRLCRALALLLLLLVAPAAVSEPPASPPAGPPDPEPQHFSVDVDLVVLHATVRNRRGLTVPGLVEQDFAVFEDGIRQSIRLFQREDVPVTAGLVVDHSGSMRRKLADVIAAARTFARSSNPDDQMFVVNFSEHPALGLPPSIPFTNDPDELDRAIARVQAVGQTALYDAVGVALHRLQSGSRAKKVLIIISDGGDNRSARNLAEVLDLAGRSSAILYTIGIFNVEDEDRNPNVLRRLARTTGGEAFFPEQQDAVVAICERIAHEIRSQYVIGYVSTNATHNGSPRSVRVAATSAVHGQLVVRTRTGYIR